MFLQIFTKVFFAFITLGLIDIIGTLSKENDLELYPPWLETYRYVNETYKVTCKTQVLKNLTWLRSNGASITEKNGKIRIQKIQFGIMLIFERLTLNAEGDYKCVASDNGAVQSSVFTLRVAEPLVFTSPTVLKAVMNEDVLLQCKVNGNHSLEKHWEFNGSVLAVEPYAQNSDGLPIQNVGLQHAGKYLCVVAHSPFQSNQNILEITLIVYNKPILRNGRKSETTTMYGFINETSSIVCEVTANPETWFVWYRNFDNALNPKNDNVSIISENNTSILQITLTEARSEEKFTCEACNELGCVKQSFFLRSTRKLQKPDIGLWDTYSDSAKFYVYFQDEITFYLFEYFYTVYEYDWQKPFVMNFSVGYRKPQLGSYMSFQLTNLHPDTKYVTRVAAGNSYTLSEFSDERKFKTRMGSSLYSICSSTNNRSCNSILLIFILFLSFKYFQ